MKNDKQTGKKSSSEETSKLYNELNEHFVQWSEDNETRMTRKHGWNEITRAYWGKLPEDWPYISKITDPRIRTSIIEKDARLLNKKPKGKVIPRGDGANMIKASVQNAVLSQQWDNATFGGTMQEKLIISSQDARLYSSKFAYVYWREVLNNDGEVTFAGNEFQPWDIRDCGMDAKADHVRNAKWFQHREWFYIEDLEDENKAAGKTIWKNLRKVKSKMNSDEFKVSDRKDNVRTSQVLSIQGLPDRIGEDSSYPVIEVVTEFREDRWISFSTRYGEIVRDIKNPNKHGMIPVSQLRYYPIQDDALGESEVEPVISLWLAIQAVLCGYLDEMILKMRPPLKIVENSVRIETIEYGPEAQWLMDNPDAVTEMRGNGEAQRWFETTYAALVSAFNTAMGDLSQNTSSADMFNGEKTATEIKQVAKQQNARDQRNQNELSDFITDVVTMWIGNNKQYYFSDPKNQSKIIDLIGQEQYEEFQNLGLSDMTFPDESMDMIQGIMEQSNYEIGDGQLADMMDASMIPEHPFVENPEEEDLSKLLVSPKLEVDEKQNSAKLHVVPQDFDGNFSYIVDVKSMEMGASEEYIASRQLGLSMIKDETILGLLQQEGWVPKIKDLLVSILNEGGLNDSQRYFKKAEVAPVQGGAPGPGGVQPNQPAGGLQGAPAPQAQGGGNKPLGRPSQVLGSASLF